MTDDQRENIDYRLLLLTPTGRDAELTAAILKRAGIDSLACASPEEVCEKCEEGSGALLIAEEAIPRTDKNCLIRFVEEQPTWSDLPVLVLARSRADSAAVAMAMDRLGNVTVLERPTRVAALVSAVRTAMRARRRQYQLRDEEEQLRQAHDELESRVSERTTKLRVLNEQLEAQIREREAAERQAHELLRQVVTAQETERSRIARDLHDELGQQMTSLRLHLAEVSRNLTDPDKTRSELERVEQQANRIDDQISFLAWQIRPSHLEKIGIVEALERYVNEWSRNFNVAAEFIATPPAPPALQPEIEINLYRIAQEALNNVAKYANATGVEVLLAVNNREVSIIVEDDGSGFDPGGFAGKNGHGGFGLKGMQERAELLGGSFEIESAPGSGTRVLTRIPAKFRNI